VQKICDFSGVSSSGILDALTSGRSKLSRYTLTPPSADKWRRNAAALARVLPGLEDTVEFIRTSASTLPEDEFDLSIDAGRPGDPGADQGGATIGVDSDSGQN
jgi:hypothetical protein